MFPTAWLPKPWTQLNKIHQVQDGSATGCGTIYPQISGPILFPILLCQVQSVLNWTWWTTTVVFAYQCTLALFKILTVCNTEFKYLAPILIDKLTRFTELCAKIQIQVNSPRSFWTDQVCTYSGEGEWGGEGRGGEGRGGPIKTQPVANTDSLCIKAWSVTTPPRWHACQLQVPPSILLGFPNSQLALISKHTCGGKIHCWGEMFCLMVTYDEPKWWE